MTLRDLLMTVQTDTTVSSDQTPHYYFLSLVHGQWWVLSLYFLRHSFVLPQLSQFFCGVSSPFPVLHVFPDLNSGYQREQVTCIFNCWDIGQPCYGSFEKMNKSLVSYRRFLKVDMMARHTYFLHWCLWYPGPSLVSMWGSAKKPSTYYGKCEDQNIIRFPSIFSSSRSFYPCPDKWEEIRYSSHLICQPG